jgi:hypothetical protein
MGSSKHAVLHSVKIGTVIEFKDQKDYDDPYEKYGSFLCVEIDQECIKGFGNDVLVLEDDNYKYRGHLEQAENDEKEDPSFQDENGHEVVEEENGDISETSGNNSESDDD